MLVLFVVFAGSIRRHRGDTGRRGRLVFKVVPVGLMRFMSVTLLEPRRRRRKLIVIMIRRQSHPGVRFRRRVSLIT